MKTGILALDAADLSSHPVWLRRLALAVALGGDHAEDAVQDTFAAALQHPPALDRDLRPWFARVLINFGRTWHRTDLRRRARDAETVGLVDPETPSAEEILIRREATRM